ncbi:MAG: hypothetical protein ABSG05_01235 [Candidatus Pacearchaeota archaeon]|jgi:hypothetical protein
MDEASADIISDGRKFVLDQLGLGEEQLRLIGKLVWLKTDEKVDFMHYHPNQRQFYVKFKEFISIQDLERLLDRYEVPKKHSRATSAEALLKPFGPDGIEVLFAPVKYS